MSNKKYWDIITAKKKENKNKTVGELMYEYTKNSKSIIYTTLGPSHNISERECLHKGCVYCHGTGVGPFGPCIHMISCPCEKCSPRMMTSDSTIKKFYEGPMTWSVNSTNDEVIA